MTNQEEFLSSTTTDKEKYIRTWTGHVNQLINLGLPLMTAGKNTDYYDELLDIQDRLDKLIQIAADEDFK